ncbi:MAG: RNA polymerase factor sigma-54 [Spirochaetia bacterium]|nr:RNA polymerase factor sigma-54 [Spirochaetia bacterium]
MPKAQLKTKVRLKLSPQSRKRLNILALSNANLRRELNKHLQENPFLEEKNSDFSLGAERVSYKNNIRSFAQKDFSKDSTAQIIENIADTKKTLREYLKDQLKLMINSSRLYELAARIVSTLDEKGFACASHEKTAKEGGFSRAELGSVIEYLKQLDLLGAGAENIWQSLKWQAQKKYPDDILLYDIISLLEKISVDFSDDLNKLSKTIAHLLHLEEIFVSEKLKIISKLNIYPAVNFTENEKNAYIVPDIIFSHNKKKITSNIDSNILTQTQLNSGLYRQFIQAEKNAIWEEKYKEVQDFLADVEYRSEKLASLASFLIKKEPFFFENGIKGIAPLNLKEAAVHLKIHISTVSRLLKDKYFQCSFGIYPLKLFFSNKIKTSMGEAKNIYNLKDAIDEIIKIEDKKNPYSDEKIAVLLEKKGYDLKRRTVAKYRKLLHIPSTKKRKA